MEDCMEGAKAESMTEWIRPPKRPNLLKGSRKGGAEGLVTAAVVSLSGVSRSAISRQHPESPMGSGRTFGVVNLN